MSVSVEEIEVEWRLKELLRSSQQLEAHTVGEVTIIITGEHVVLLRADNIAAVISRSQFCGAMREYADVLSFIARIC
jgi:hypothetical protein